jgi:GH24 family phage-related lysozyme (muramidase)
MDIAKLKKQLIFDEGVVYEIYLDHLGNPTFGVGHLITKNDPEYGLEVGTEVSEERVWSVLKKDIAHSIIDVKTLYGRSQFESWPEEVKQIVVNMMFNMGINRMRGFVNFKAALEKRDWKEAAKEGRDSLWHRQVTNRAERLMTRLEKLA